MILCARSTSRSRDQSTKHRSRSEKMRYVCLFYGQKARLHDYQTWPTHKFTGCAKVSGLFFLAVSFRTLTGWAGKLPSHGFLGKYRLIGGRRVLHVHSPLLLFSYLIKCRHSPSIALVNTAVVLPHICDTKRIFHHRGSPC